MLDDRLVIGERLERNQIVQVMISNVIVDVPPQFLPNYFSDEKELAIGTVQNSVLVKIVNGVKERKGVTGFLVKGTGMDEPGSSVAELVPIIKIARIEPVRDPVNVI